MLEKERETENHPASGCWVPPTCPLPLSQMQGDTQEGCTTGLAGERAPRKALPRLVDMLGSRALSSLKSMTRARETLTFSKA